MTDLYEHYDEINAELRELAARSEAESEPKRIYVGSGEDFSPELVEEFA